MRRYRAVSLQMDTDGEAEGVFFVMDETCSIEPAEERAR